MAAATTTATQTELRVETPAAAQRVAAVDEDRPRGWEFESVSAGVAQLLPTRANTSAVCTGSTLVRSQSRLACGTAKMFGRSNATGRLSTDPAIGSIR
jgi:hypothetical protein